MDSSGLHQPLPPLVSWSPFVWTQFLLMSDNEKNCIFSDKEGPFSSIIRNAKFLLTQHFDIESSKSFININLCNPNYSPKGVTVMSPFSQLQNWHSNSVCLVRLVFAFNHWAAAVSLETFSILGSSFGILRIIPFSPWLCPENLNCLRMMMKTFNNTQLAFTWESVPLQSIIILITEIRKGGTTGQVSVTEPKLEIEAPSLMM